MQDIIGRRHALALGLSAAIATPLAPAAQRAGTPTPCPVRTEAKIYVLLDVAPEAAGSQLVPVAERLRASGHRAFLVTPTDRVGDKRQVPDDVTSKAVAESVASLTVTQDLRDVVLVGHRFGSVPVTAVADRVPERIREVVCLDGIIVPAAGGRMGWHWAELAADQADPNSAPDQVAWLLATIG